MIESNVKKFPMPRWAVIVGYGKGFEELELWTFECWTAQMARYLAKERMEARIADHEQPEEWKIYSVGRLWRDGEAV